MERVFFHTMESWQRWYDHLLPEDFEVKKVDLERDYEYFEIEAAPTAPKPLSKEIENGSKESYQSIDKITN